MMFRKIQRPARWMAIGVLFLTLACGSDSDDELTAETGTPATETPFTQSATQSGSQGDVDILFVLDSSQSLGAERDRLAAALPELVDQLTETGSITVAFLLGWVTPDASGGYDGSGSLYHLSTNDPVMSSATLSLSLISSKVAATLQAEPPPDLAADGGEAGMHALNELLTTRRSEAESAGFLRSGAFFSAIFLSDENAICATYPDGVTPVPDPEGLEESTKATYCNGLTASGLLDTTRSVMGSTVQFSGIVYTGPDAPPAEHENEIGYGYLDLINLSQGVAIDLSQSSFSEGARNLGNTINALAASLQRRFVLSQSPANPLSIEVLVDGEPVTFQFISDDNAVILDFAGHPGSIIEINYRVLDK